MYESKGKICNSIYQSSIFTNHLLQSKYLSAYYYLTILNHIIDQGSGSYLQRTGTIRLVGLFWRVQPHRATSLVRGRPAGGRSSLRQERKEKDLRLHRRWHFGDVSRIRHLYYHGSLFSVWVYYWVIRRTLKHPSPQSIPQAAWRNISVITTSCNVLFIESTFKLPSSNASLNTYTTQNTLTRWMPRVMLERFLAMSPTCLERRNDLNAARAHPYR